MKNPERTFLRLLVDAVGPVLAAHRSTTGHVTEEQITEAWMRYDDARRVLGDRPIAEQLAELHHWEEEK